jgi:hypothetical protein
LLHRYRHPDAEPEQDDEADKIEQALEAIPAKLDGWLRDRLGVTTIRLRQRVRELLRDLDGRLDDIVVDPDRFARAVTKTRNWHTHYGDSSGVLEREHASYLAIRLWAVVRASVLVELGWTPAEAADLVALDHTSSWVATQPLAPGD